MSLGSTLRTARESHGLTTSELAARTHMLVQIVEGLENEDFRRIPAPIYGRGFVKLYCEAVGLDPKPLQVEFMDLFNRSKDAPEKTYPLPPKRNRPEVPEASAVPPPAPIPESAENTQMPDADLESAAADTEEMEPASSQAEVQSPDADFGELFAHPQPPPKRSYGALFEQAYAEDPKPSKPSAAEKFRNSMSNVSSGVFSNVQKLPRNTGRIAAVSVFAIILVVLLGWGISILYKATTPSDTPRSASVDTKNRSENEVEPAKTKKAMSDKNLPSSKRSPDVKPQDIKSSGIETPALYID